MKDLTQETLKLGCTFKNSSNIEEGRSLREIIIYKNSPYDRDVAIANLPIMIQRKFRYTGLELLRINGVQTMAIDYV